MGSSLHMELREAKILETMVYIVETYNMIKANTKHVDDVHKHGDV
jgi:hypothetical protein